MKGKQADNTYKFPLFFLIIELGEQLLSWYLSLQD
jgi:hypothetical protein